MWSTWAYRAIEQGARAAEAWREATRRVRDRTEWVSGWHHDYYCPDDGHRLIWAIGSPRRHRCPHCGQICSGTKFDQAWVTGYRSRMHDAIRYHFALYRLTREAVYLEWACDQLDFYARHYAQFTPSGQWTNPGRMLSQPLDEAVWAVRVLEGAEWVKDAIPKDRRDGWYRGLFGPMAENLLLHRDSIHNHECWYNAAVGLIGFFLGRNELIEPVFSDSYSLSEQLRQGLTPEGFWREGSTLYHLYTLKSLLPLVTFALRYGRDVRTELQQVRRMFAILETIAFPNGELPNPNDGWPRQSLADALPQLECALGLFPGDDALLDLLARARALQELGAAESRDPAAFRSPKSFPPQLETLAQAVFQAPSLLELRPTHPSPTQPVQRGTAGTPAVIDLPGSNVAIVKSQVFQAFLKYGHQVRGHAHPDKMNVELYAGDRVISHDPGTSGYGARIDKEWYKSTLAHNTVTVDERNQEAIRPGMTERIDRENSRITVSDPEIYSGVGMRRSLQLLENTMIDTFEVDSDTEHIYDWTFHVEGWFDAKGVHAEASGENRRTVAGLPVSGAYRYLRNVHGLAVDGDWHVTWIVPGGRLTLWVRGEFGTEVYTFESPDNPAQTFRAGILIRRRARSTCFHAQWEWKHALS